MSGNSGLAEHATTTRKVIGMTNISLYEAQKQNSRLNRLVRHLGFSNPDFFDESNVLTSLTINLDVAEDEENYWVHADLPGVKKNDIRVSVEGNQVSIVAEIKVRNDDKREKAVIHSERYHGKVMRNFTLDNHIDETRTLAKYSDGVLELILPKRSGGQNRKQIAVQ
jgi:HSP20 family protein